MTKKEIMVAKLFATNTIDYIKFYPNTPDTHYHYDDMQTFIGWTKFTENGVQFMNHNGVHLLAYADILHCSQFVFTGKIESVHGDYELFFK